MTLERRALYISRLLGILLVLVSLRIVYWQMLRARDLQPVAFQLDLPATTRRSEDDWRRAFEFLNGVAAGQDQGNLPQPVIQRTINRMETITRGSIFDRSGRLLAQERLDADGQRMRFYTEPSLAHVIGYVSGMRTGVTGLELSYNGTLLGLTRPDAQIEQMLKKPITGSDLILTIDSAVQRAAEQALGGRAGAIVALDGRTGAVLAMTSAPRFDPNRVLEESYVASLLEGCELDAGCQSPFLNRATQAQYTPGSTWKTVTLIAALDSGLVSPETVFDFGRPRRGPGGSYYVYEVDGGIIPDPNHSESRLNLEMSYARSANAAFARMGDEMGAATLLEYARRLGFGAPGEIDFSLEIEYVPSQIAHDPQSLVENNLLRAATAIGQGELLTSPLNMSMVVLPVLNDGDMPLPYLVHSVRSPQGRENDSLPNRRMVRDVMRPETARLVREMMITTVRSGSGSRALIPGAVVGGKTGTAQLGGDQAPHAWFIGFAEEGDRSVVVAVIIENGGSGFSAAAPAFARVAEAALRRAGEPVEEVVPTPQPPPTSMPTAAPEEQPLIESLEGVFPSQPSEDEAAGQNGSSALSVPTPEIPRRPNGRDITSANPTCAGISEFPPATGQFIWPTRHQTLVGDDFHERHPGIDQGAPLGSRVVAADAGVVLFAGWSAEGYGNVVLIDHGNGYQTLYAHLSQVSVSCGQAVEQEKLIGLSGETGNTYGPHLHFEVRVPGGFIDPLSVLPLP